MDKEGKRHKKRMSVIIRIVLILVAAIMIPAAIPFPREQKDFPMSQEVFGNPLMGYAPGAGTKEVSEDINLLYMDITWRELEPEEGQFDWETIEQENQLDRWRNEGKHMVLRFVCDIPGKESHMDIPDWLYEKTGQDGTWYDTEYGKGFSPDYGNELFIRYHEKAVQAIGEHLGIDTFISYIELGSLGHWGEWHVNYEAGITRLPSEEVRKQYVLPWIDAFPNAKILMRRPFSEAEEYGLGVYNDMTGRAKDTQQWLTWMEEGSVYEQTGEKNAIVPIPDFWEKAPVGGEFTSSLSMEEMLQSNLGQTLDLIGQSHVTFLGPKIAEDKYEEGYEAVLAKMGYRLQISEASLKSTLGGMKLTMIWKNNGAAPMYVNWPVYVYVEDRAGDTIETVPVNIDLSTLLPGERQSVSVNMKSTGLSGWGRKECRICVGIVDPMTGKNVVRLAMDAPWSDGRTVLFD